MLVPNEVKWDANELKKNTEQVKELRKRSGFCSAINLPSEKNRIPEIDYVEIPYVDFRQWFLEQAPNLLEETIFEKVGDAAFHVTPNHWLIPIRSKNGVENFKKMMDTSPQNPFWAFQKAMEPMKAILGIKRGDRCLFLHMRGSPGQIRLPSKTKEYLIESWHEGKITIPYHVRTEGPFAHVFEKETSLANRRWPHFIAMKFENNGICHFHLKLNQTLGEQLATAINRYHAPLCISKADYDQIYQKCIHQIEV